MKLLTLKLENFQGIKAASFDFGGQNATIYGDNATGKTTIFNAMTWLLFDKASTGAKNYTPKTKGPDGDLHYLDHAAEAQFQADSGRIITLKKIYHENYKKKRGSSTEEFDGHSVDFYLDGVPVKEKEYQSTLESLFGAPELLKMLTMPTYFSEDMPWDVRRKILLEICGDVTDDDVIASTLDLKDLPAYLLMPGAADQRYSVEEYKKIATATKAKINKQLQEIPGRIDEAQRAIPDLTGIDEQEIDRKIDDLTKTKSKAETDKAKALAGDTAASAIREQIAEANAQLAEAKTAHIQADNAKNETANEEVAAIRRKISAAKGAAESAAENLRIYKARLARMNLLRQDLLTEYSSVQKKNWDESAAICPACLRPLPDEDIQKLREKYNQRKSQTLTNLNARGQQECSKDMIVELETEIKDLEALHSEHSAKVAELERQLSEASAKIVAPAMFESTKEYDRIMERIKSLHQDETSREQTMEAIAAQYTDKILDLHREIRAQEELKTRITVAAGQKKRIAELDTQEKDLAGQYEDLERGIYLCELFIKTKVDMLTARINEKFRHVRFRLFQEQLNGGVKEDCEVMIPADGGRMVPFTFANNAARINAGLEIIGVLSQHWGVSMPVFVDNAESVTRLTSLDSQVIRLVVSEQDKTLRMEVGK